MAIFQRLGDLLKSNINDLLDRAEDPEKMVKQIIIDMEKELEKCTETLGEAMGSQRQIKKQLEKSQTDSKSWEDKAKLALKNNNEELAKQALAKKLNSDKQVSEYQKMYDECTVQVDTIKGQVDALKVKLDEARSRQSTLIARSKMADTQKSMAKTLGNMDSSSAFNKLDRMEERIENKESQAQAFSELSGTSTADPFKELESTSAVDDELARLKSEMNQ